MYVSDNMMKICLLRELNLFDFVGFWSIFGWFGGICRKCDNFGEIVWYGFG